MLNAIPLMPAAEGWDQDVPTMVLQMSLDDYMACFWDDDAPYYIPAHLNNKMTGEGDRVVNYTNWYDP